jgi:two-component system chemotaxis sensor kinase CheA
MVMTEETREIVEEFIAESREGLESLDQLFVALESDPANSELLNQIFRVVHTIKGSAGFLHLNPVVTLTHALEDLLSCLRQSRMRVSPDLMDILLEGVDLLKAMVADLANGEEQTAGVEQIVTKLALALELYSEPAASPVAEEVGSEALAERPQVSEETRRSAHRSGDAIDHPSASELPRAEVTQGKRSGEEGVQQETDERTIRVDTERLDTVINLAGELVLARNQFLKLAHRLARRYPEDQIVTELVESGDRLSLLTTDLQAAVMRTRMQPVRKLFSRIPRLVRTLARELGKEVAVHLAGEETELDRSVLERLNDPLIHLVRNAVDHGLEFPEERLARGKPRQGRLCLSAAHEGGHILIKIVDDGRGIDLQKVLQRALSLGLVEKAAADHLSPSEIIDFIFRPGFSTTTQVSSLSGRGVGMDVVKTNIRKLGGFVSVDTQVGHGTQITVQIPLTVAVIQALLVQVVEQTYALPLGSVVEIVHTPEHVQAVGRRNVIVLHDRLIPLVSLKHLFALAGESYQPRWSYVVVVRLGEQPIGLVVERLLGIEEVVVKPLDGFVENAHFFGATIAGDGRVVLILDLQGLLHNVTALYAHAPYVSH